MEVWNDIVGFEDYYMVSNLGRVKRKSREVNNNSYGGKMIMKGKILSPYLSKKGYSTLRLQVDNKRYSFPVHRLVAKAFIDNPDDKPQVNHIDGDKTNNNVTNLEWCNNSENQLHAYKNGLQKLRVGESNSNSKLESHEVLEIRRMLENGVEPKKIMGIYNVTKTVISSIKHRRSWKHI